MKENKRFKENTITMCFSFFIWKISIKLYFFIEKKYKPMIFDIFKKYGVEVLICEMKEEKQDVQSFYIL